MVALRQRTRWAGGRSFGWLASQTLNISRSSGSLSDILSCAGELTSSLLGNSVNGSFWRRIIS